MAVVIAVTEKISKPDPLDWLSEFEMTDEEVKQIGEQEYVIDRLLPDGQITVIVGGPGTGKTTVIFYLAVTQMAKEGYQVIYVHADTYPTEAAKFKTIADEAGIRYLTPDMKHGLTIRDALNRFYELARDGESLEKMVIIFDTLKKLANLMNKGDTALLMSKLRTIVARGATVVLLGHINKNTNAEGNDVFEGVGDVINDGDNLIYFVSCGSKGKHVVSTLCKPWDGMGKMRADIGEFSWQINKDRSVRAIEHVDADEARHEQTQREKDKDAIDAIHEAIAADMQKQKDVCEFCHERYEMGGQRVRRVLKAYEGKEWKNEGGCNKNAKRYVAIQKTAPPSEPPNNQEEF